MSSETHRDMELSATGLLSAEQVSRLEEHWITTLEQFLILGANQDRRTCGAKLLGVEGEAFDGMIDRAKALAPELAAEAVAYPYEDFLGCLEPTGEAVQAPVPEEFLAAAGPLPEGANLIAKMNGVRDQGRRGACVAFASTAMREYLTGRREYELSEQFLYWVCKERDGQAGAGTYLSVALGALLEVGICRAQEWAYNPNPIDGNEGQGPPPLGAEALAAKHRLAKSFCLVPRPGAPVQMGQFKACLGGSSARPIAFSVPLFDSFFNQATRRTGRVIMPLPGESVRGGHAMCVVGYQDYAGVPGGGLFLVRNSWGEGWAYGCEFGPGHALIPYKYVQQHCWEAYSGDAAGVSAAAPRRAAERAQTRLQTDYGFCAACGKRILTQLDIAGQCMADGCEAPLCNHCYTGLGRRTCRKHEKPR